MVLGKGKGIVYPDILATKWDAVVRKKYLSFFLNFSYTAHLDFKRSSLRWEKIYKTELYASVKHGEPTVYTTNQILPFETARRLNLVQTVGVP